MSKTENIQAEAGVTAVIHPSDEGWRSIIADTRGPRPRLMESEQFGRDQASRIGPWLSEHRVADVLYVLPSSAVICRTCPLPDAPDQQLEQALALQAEAGLLGIAPAHRLGMAVLPTAIGETTRCGLVLAWPEAAKVAAPPISRSVEYAADVAALAALLNGDRPTDPLIWLDSGDGSVAMALTHANGAVFRATREDVATPDTWTQSVSRVVAETALSVGHTASFVDATIEKIRHRLTALNGTPNALMLPPDVIAAAAPRISGAPTDERWWSRYGIAAGALLARTGQLSKLTRLQNAAPMERPSRIRALVASLSSPRVAATLVVACMLTLMFGPMILNGLRLQMLHLRHPDLSEQLAAVQEARRHRAMYTELDKQAWPMTKLLSDIACSTPPGIELDSVRITHGETFTVSGLAKPQSGQSATEVVALMQDQLQASGIFSEIDLNWGDRDAYRNYQFDLSAKVTRPGLRPDYDESRDYGLWTLAERRDGDPPRTAAAPTAALAAADPDASTDDPPVEARVEPDATDAGAEPPPPSAVASAESPDADAAAAVPRTNGDGERARRPATRSGSNPLGGERISDPTARASSGLAPSQDIPELLTPEQIESLTVEEARDMLGKVAQARRYARDDQELQDKLKEQFELLMARVRNGP